MKYLPTPYFVIKKREPLYGEISYEDAFSVIKDYVNNIYERITITSMAEGVSFDNIYIDCMTAAYKDDKLKMNEDGKIVYDR